MEQGKRYRRSQSDKIQVEQRWMGVWGGKSLVSGGNARRSGVTGAESYGRMYRADTAPDNSVMIGRSRKKSRRCWKSWTKRERGRMPEIIKERQQATTLFGGRNHDHPASAVSSGSLGAEGFYGWCRLSMGAAFARPSAHMRNKLCSVKG